MRSSIYATVVAFAAAPTVFGLDGFSAGLAYALAGVHLLIWLVSDYSRVMR